MQNYISVPVAPLASVAQRTEGIKLYGPDAFEGMRRAGALTAQCLDAVANIVRPGARLSEINTFVLDFAATHGARPATLGAHSTEVGHRSTMSSATDFRQKRPCAMETS